MTTSSSTIGFSFVDLFWGCSEEGANDGDGDVDVDVDCVGDDVGDEDDLRCLRGVGGRVGKTKSEGVRVEFDVDG